MIEKITEINISTDFINLTKFQQVQEISTQPYFLTGIILIFAFLIIWKFFSGFSKISPNSSKICFESWIWWAGWIPIILLAAIVILWFYAPFHLSLI